MQPPNLFNHLMDHYNDAADNAFKPLKRIPKLQGIHQDQLRILQARITEYLNYLNNIKVEMGKVTSDHYAGLKQEELLRIRPAIQKYLSCGELVYTLMEVFYTDIVCLENQLKEIEDANREDFEPNNDDISGSDTCQ